MTEIEERDAHIITAAVAVIEAHTRQQQQQQKIYSTGNNNNYNNRECSQVALQNNGKLQYDVYLGNAMPQ